MKPYAKYKPSGIEWLADVPEHWQPKKLKYGIRYEKGRNAQTYTAEFISQNPGPFPVFSGQTENQGVLGFTGEADYEVQQGLIVTTVGAKAMSVKLVQGKFALSQNCALFTPKNEGVWLNFFFHYLTRQFEYEKSRMANILQPSLRFEDLDTYDVCFPPLPEQRAIAEFLDEKTKQIDTLIEKKRRLIELLREERQAVITSAVTKGLNPNAGPAPDSDRGMKPSGIEWLGDVPEGWELWKVSHSFSLIGSGTTPEAGNELYYQSGTIPWLLTGDLNDATITSTTKQITETALREYSTLKTYPKNSLVIAMYGATIGKLGLLGIETTVNQACCVLASSKVFDIRFAFYWFLVNKAHIISLSFGGGQPNISQELIKSLRIQCPPLPEQKAITSFLDHKTNELDTLIEKKRRLIELLREERQAVITSAVTKGLNPNAGPAPDSDRGMKPSGIEWLGDVPEGWEVKKLKYCLSPHKGALKTGPFGSDLKNSDLTEEGFRVYNQRSVLDRNFDEGDYISAQKFEALKDFEIFEGDILITSRGTIGVTAIFPPGKERGILHPCLIRIEIGNDILDSDFLLDYLGSSLFAENVQFNSNATTIEVIYGDTLKHVFIPIPPLKEQRAIAAFLDEKTKQFDTLITRAERSISLLTEYRTALITEVVTGKVDVREYANKE